MEYTILFNLELKIYLGPICFELYYYYWIINLSEFWFTSVSYEGHIANNTKKKKPLHFALEI